MADELTMAPAKAAPASNAAAPAPNAEREVQERLVELLPWLAAFDAELLALHERLPPPAAVEADALEEDERPESLSQYLRAAIDCARIDWLPRLRAVLDRATAMRQADLDREWAIAGESALHGADDPHRSAG